MNRKTGKSHLGHQFHCARISSRIRRLRERARKRRASDSTFSPLTDVRLTGEKSRFHRFHASLTSHPNLMLNAAVPLQSITVLLLCSTLPHSSLLLLYSILDTLRSSSPRYSSLLYSTLLPSSVFYSSLLFFTLLCSPHSPHRLSSSPLLSSSVLFSSLPCSPLLSSPLLFSPLLSSSLLDCALLCSALLYSPFLFFTRLYSAHWTADF